MSDICEPLPPVDWLRSVNPLLMVLGLPRSQVWKEPEYSHPYSRHPVPRARQYRLLAAALWRHGYCGAAGSPDATELHAAASLLDGRDGFSLDFDWGAFDDHVREKLMLASISTREDTDTPEDQYVPYYRDEFVLTAAGMMAHQSTSGGRRPATRWLRPVVHFRRSRSITGTRFMVEELTQPHFCRDSQTLASHRATVAGFIRCVFPLPTPDASAAKRGTHSHFVAPPVGVFSAEWRTRTVLGIARSAAAERSWGHLPILADALQDAGCDDEYLLEHLRGPGPHCRGCWAVDQALGVPNVF